MVTQHIDFFILIGRIYPEADVIPYGYTLDSSNALELIKQ